MIHVRLFLKVPCHAESLNSNDVFVLFSKKFGIFVWAGKVWYFFTSSWCWYGKQMLLAEIFQNELQQKKTFGQLRHLLLSDESWRHFSTDLTILIDLMIVRSYISLSTTEPIQNQHTFYGWFFYCHNYIKLLLVHLLLEKLRCHGDWPLSLVLSGLYRWWTWDGQTDCQCFPTVSFTFTLHSFNYYKVTWLLYKVSNTT